MFPVYQVTNSSNKGRCPLSRYWAELCPGCVGEAQGEGLVIIISIIRANKETEQIKKSASSIILLWQTWNLLVCQTTFFLSDNMFKIDE